MTKKLSLILSVLFICAFALTACGNNWQNTGGPDKNAPVKNNGSFIVEKGDYYFFINGEAASGDENEFGKPVKGALMRQKKDGSDKPVIIVPKLFVAGDKTSGVFIYGEDVYYATPSSTRDKNNNIQTNYLDFCKMSINGGGDTVLFTKDTAALKYRYYLVGNTVYLIYVDVDGSIHSVKDGSGKSTKIVDQAKNSVFPDNIDEGFIYYAKDVEEEIPSNSPSPGSDEEPEKRTMYYNEVFRIKPDGSGNEKIYSGDKKNAAKDQRYALLSYENDILYFSKECGNSVTQALGVFGVKKEFLTASADEAKQVLICLTATGNYKFLGIDGANNSKGMIIAQSDGIYQYGQIGQEPDKLVDEGSATPQFFYNSKWYYTVSSGSGLYTLPEGSISKAYAKQIGTVKLNTDWHKPVILNGKMFYLSSDSNHISYVCSFDLDNPNIDNKTEPKLLGEFSESDFATYKTNQTDDFDIYVSSLGEMTKVNAEKLKEKKEEVSEEIEKAKTKEGVDAIIKDAKAFADSLANKNYKDYKIQDLNAYAILKMTPANKTEIRAIEKEGEEAIWNALTKDQTDAAYLAAKARIDAL